MVATLLIVLFFALVTSPIWIPLLRRTLEDLTKTPEERKKEEEKGLTGKVVEIVVGSGGVKPHSEVVKEGAGATASNNLKSNLTLTPLPDDPLFGTEGIFTKAAKGIQEFFNPQNRAQTEGEVEKTITQSRQKQLKDRAAKLEFNAKDPLRNRKRLSQ